MHLHVDLSMDIDKLIKMMIALATLYNKNLPTTFQVKFTNNE